MSQSKKKDVAQRQWLKFLPKNKQKTKEKQNDLYAKMDLSSIPIHNSVSNKTDRDDIANNIKKMTINDSTNYDIKDNSNSKCLFDNFDTFSNESSLIPFNNNQDTLQIEHSKLQTKDNQFKQNNHITKDFNALLNQDISSNNHRENKSSHQPLTNNDKKENQLSLSPLSQYHSKNKNKSKLNSSSFEDDNTTMISKNPSGRGIGYQLYNHNSNLLSLELLNHNSIESSLNRNFINKSYSKQANRLNQSQINSYQKISTYRNRLPPPPDENKTNYSKWKKSHLYKSLPKNDKSNITSYIPASKQKCNHINTSINSLQKENTNIVKDNKSISYSYNKKKIPKSSQCQTSQLSLLTNYSNTINKAYNPSNDNKNDNHTHMNNNDYNHHAHYYNNEVVELIEDIKEKYQKEEKNKIIKESELLSEISRLRSKLKEMSLNEENNQIILEKLRRQAHMTNSAYFKKIKKVNKLNISNEDECLANELNQLSKDFDVPNSSKREPFLIKDTPKLKSYLYLCKQFNLNKHLIYDNTSEKDFIDDIDEKEKMIKVLNDNLTLKAFINTLANRLNHECNSRLLLEEKSLKIFSNDLKTIDLLEKKIQKLGKKPKSTNLSLISNDISNCSINSC